VADYLRSASGASAPTPLVNTSSTHVQPSQYSENLASEQLTSELLERARDIIQRAEGEGRDPDEELRQVVGQTVIQGMVAGYGMGVLAEEEGQRGVPDEPDAGPKRTRTDST
jgi:hypothetical protein